MYTFVNSVFQFQSFSQYRSKLLKKGEDEVGTLRANTKVLHFVDMVFSCQCVTLTDGHSVCIIQKQKEIGLMKPAPVINLWVSEHDKYIMLFLLQLPVFTLYTFCMRYMCSVLQKCRRPAFSPATHFPKSRLLYHAKLKMISHLKHHIIILYNRMSYDNNYKF